MIELSTLKENVFLLFYVVNEEMGRDESGPWRFRLWIAIYIVDALQVLRVLFSSRYGWSWAIVNVAKSLNVIELALSMGSTIPRVVFYAVGQMLVAAAVADALYIINTYQQGTLKHRFPVKFLGVMISGLVTTFFPSCLGWILFPADCGLDEGGFFSVLIHGPKTGCAPWGVPEFGLTLLSILISTVFIVASLVASYLLFEVNPMSQHVRAACTGRVELLWTVVRSLCIIFGLLTFYFQAAICAAVVFVLAAGLMHYHMSVMPFHSLVENIVRGGVYTSVAWSALTSILISSVSDPSSPPSSSLFAVQWICVAIVPAVFCGGMTLIFMRHRALTIKIRWLRREWEISPDYQSHAHRRRRRRSATSSISENTGNELNIFAKLSAFDRFFDLEFEANRAFKSPAHAHLLARIILQERKKSDIPFLSYVLKKGLQEYPESRDLIILNLLLMRSFVRAQAISQTSAHERMIEALSDHTTIEHDYILFASQRGSGQPDAKGAAAKNDINAFQMLEFEMKFEKVQKLHHECVLALKGFWLLLYKHKKIFRAKKKFNENLAERVEELLTCLDTIESCKEAAQEGYRGLLDKFPRSVSVLRSFAGFCDVILNRAWEASQYRDQALLLEADDDAGSLLGSQVDANDADNGDGGNGGVAKSTASSSELDGTGRKMDRFFASWRESVMSRELGGLRALDWRIFNATLLILIVCTVGFSLTDSMLYEQTAHESINLIIGAQVFRVDLMDALFSVRSLFLAGSQDPSSLYKYRARLDGISQSFANAHVQNFQAAPDAIVSFYNSPEWNVVSPSSTGWTTSSTSLWSLGNQIASQIGLTSGLKESDVKNWTNSLSDISPELRAADFLNENTFQNMIPALEKLGQVYIDQVVAFGSLTRAMITINVVLNVLLILMVAASVLRSLDGIVSAVQHERVVLLMTLYSTRASTQKIYKFYEAADKALTELEDGMMNLDHAAEEPNAKLPIEGRDRLHEGDADDYDGEQRSRNRTEGGWEQDQDRDGFYTGTGEGDDDFEGRGDYDPNDDSNPADQDYDGGGREDYNDQGASSPSRSGSPDRQNGSADRGSGSPGRRAGRQSPGARRRRDRDKDSEGKVDGGPPVEAPKDSHVVDVGGISLEAASNDIVVRSQALERMRSAPKTMRSLEALIEQRRPWYAQRAVHFVTLLIMLVICILSIVYPSRNIDTMVNMPAKRNQAGRRRFLHRACVHFARELVLGDGFSRLNSSELAAGLLWSLEELRAADDAVRLGGSLGVTTGSDQGLGGVDHNNFVYSVTPHACSQLAACSRNG
mmetsp:Transcript_17439/g.48149  ORF Transcript_17439/g.48149 Transcript_17439/m.48149 type:complete len:1292 (-) Transcript_17439:986-4861(-)